jgi:hypothetical protein
LNRINPRYIYSGRGILQLELENHQHLQNQADTYSLVMEAIRLIQSRRKFQKHNLSQDGIEALEIVEQEVQNSYYLNFPFIFGKVMDLHGMKPKIGTEIKLFVYRQDKYQPCPMKDKSWINPYVTTGDLGGNYVFWPAPFAALDQKEISKETVTFKIDMDQSLYVEEFELDIISDKMIHNRNLLKHYQLDTIVI